MRFSNLIAVLLCSALVPIAQAESVGTIGQTYPIDEESALSMIMNKLRAKERNGDMKRYQQEAVKRSLGSLKNMPPVQGIGTVTARAQRLIDPTVYYPKAITTDEGRIVVPAGAKINPLLVTGLSKRLVFFDGRDPEQASAVRRMVQRESTKVKPILVAGSWLDLTKAWKTQVYFDQKGILSERFGIRAVPSIISQQGASLLLQEVPAKELQ
jgi:conjugal transfer pilus assembly protein TraW